MLSPRPLLRSSRILSRLCTQCLLRQQSSTSKRPPPPAAPSPASEPTPPPPHRHAPPAHPAIPSYPTAAPSPKAKPKVQEDAGFPPALTGFIAGAMIAAGGLFLGYYISGGARVAKAHRERHRRLVGERHRLFGGLALTAPAGAAAGSAASANTTAAVEERLQWFEHAALFYAAYVPGAEEYVVQNWAEVAKARTTPQGEVAVLEIVKNCAAELEKLIGGGELGLYVGQQCWDTMLKHIEMVVDIAEQSRPVPDDIRQKVQKQLEALKKVGSRSGRQERKLLEERAMQEAKA